MAVSCESYCIRCPPEGRRQRLYIKHDHRLPTSWLWFLCFHIITVPSRWSGRSRVNFMGCMRDVCMYFAPCSPRSQCHLLFLINIVDRSKLAMFSHFLDYTCTRSGPRNMCRVEGSVTYIIFSLTHGCIVVMKYIQWQRRSRWVRTGNSK